MARAATNELRCDLQVYICIYPMSAAAPRLCIVFLSVPTIYIVVAVHLVLFANDVLVGAYSCSSPQLASVM